VKVVILNVYICSHTRYIHI